MIVLTSLACVGAVDTNQTEHTILQEDQNTAEIGNFTGLNDDISKIPTYGNLTLTKDYVYNYSDSDYKDGIRITSDNILIDGCGHTIDGAGQARIFNITSSNVTLKNIKFINAYSSENGGAIYSTQGLNILNSTFLNNTAGYSAGALYFAQGGTVSNSYFKNNTAGSYGGAIYFNGEGLVSDCNFTNNSASSEGGAINFWTDGKIKNSNFKGNSAQSGGSLYVKGASEVDGCNFVANRARTGGAIEFWKNGTVIHSLFKDNVATFSGGAIYANDDVCMNYCNLTNNSAEGYSGGAIYIFSFGEFADCIFTNNSASLYGGAIYFNQNGAMEKSVFEGNKANDGGAILSSGKLLIDNSTFKDNFATSGVHDICLKGNATVFYVARLTIINVSDVTYGNTVKIRVNVSYNDVAVNGGNVSVVIGNKRYTYDVVNGNATIEIPNLDVGPYSCSVAFNGHENYTETNVSVNFNVKKQNLVVSASNKAYVINYGGKYSVIVRDSTNKWVSGVKVTFVLNGKAIRSVTTNSKGVATLSLTSKMLKTAKAGKKNLVIKVTGANYNIAGKTAKIKINKEKTKIVAKKKTFKKSKKIKKYKISLKNSRGKAVKKVKLTLKVNGKKYIAKTNSKGKTIFKIKKLAKKGKFRGIVKFTGNACYKVASKKVKITVK